ncbi:MAG: PKD domain-containing protein [Bacteroidetes bacterium]|nr:MAG: PKD domain-containing protein [Bacteroidota bacterium]
MRKIYLLLFVLMTPLVLSAQFRASNLSPHAAFEWNKGQWEEDFDFKLKLKAGALFFEDGGYSARIQNPDQLERILDHSHGEEDHHGPLVPFEKIQEVAYRVQYINANSDAVKQGSYPFHHYTNYFIGNDPNKWAANVPLYGVVTYADFYPNTDYRLYSSDDHFKYDFVVKPGGDPSQIQWRVDGTTMELVGDQLHYKAPFGDIEEWKPVAYQEINGNLINIEVEFSLSTDGIASFTLGEYDPAYELVIDPVIVFATFSGSSADNWGFTATYGPDGSLYGGGITFGVGYPTNTGSFDPSFNNGPISGASYTDATISKYSSDGKTLVYATYLGGAECDQPHSMIVNSANQLVVFGLTGSNDFPTNANSAQSTFGGGPVTYPFKQQDANNYHFRFPIGTDAYIAILSANGQNLVGSSYIGGSGRDAANTRIQRNYGDASRGEVVLDANDNIYIVTSTQSADYPLVNSTIGGNAGGADVGITKLSPNANTFLWSTMYGGPGDDQGYGIKVANNGDVYFTGGTTSTGLPGSANGYNPTYNGGTDGFLARFDASANIQSATYLGTSSYDQSFFVDIDKNNAIYVFGQTLGNYPITQGTWTFGNSRLFIHKFNPSLTTTIFSTAFGSTNGGMSLVPTAFNVDDCLNILLSGWGGVVNRSTGFLGGSTGGLPITADAAQASTDGSDFYFMSLSYNATALSYSTYFGGSNNEHVDGGTSRFSPDGQIYQAVCAGCNGSNDFPVTPGAYSTTNRSSNCNLGNVKFDFEVSIEAAADVDYDSDVDTICNTLEVQFTNGSRNANVYEWDFGNGQTSTAREPNVSYTNFGTYNVRLIAIDTICDISDTAYLSISHTQGIDPLADFDVSYTVCDQSRTVQLQNNSRRATNYIWDFGNGTRQFTPSPTTYSYPAEGRYTITLIAQDTVCDKADTATVVVNFNTNIPAPIVHITPSSCDNGKFDVWYENDSSYYRYKWEWEDGTIEYAKFPKGKVPRSGVQVVKLTIIDDVCNQKFDYSFTLDITRIDNRIYIPNAFSPNGDGINDVLLLKGNTCLENTKFTIFNRWGQEVFETTQPFAEFWSGNFSDGNIKEDTYTYVFISEDGTKVGYVTVLP